MMVMIKLIKYIGPPLYALLVFLLPVSNSKDSESYLQYLSYSGDYLQNAFSLNALLFLASEPVWLAVNIAATSVLKYDYEIILRIYAIFIAYSLSRYIFSKASSTSDFLICVILLGSPFLISNFVTHIRMGFALAVFLVGIRSKSNIVRFILISTSPLVHNSFYLITIFYILALFLCRLSNKKLNLILIFAFNAVITFMIIPLAASFKSAVDDPTETTGSGLGFVFFAIQMALIILQYLRNNKNNDNEGKNSTIYFTLFCMSFYFFNYYMFYGAGRIMQLAIPFVAVSLVYVKGYAKFISIPMWFAYISYDVLTRVDVDNFGF